MQYIATFWSIALTSHWLFLARRVWAPLEHNIGTRLLVVLQHASLASMGSYDAAHMMHSKLITCNDQAELVADVQQGQFVMSGFP